MSSQCELTCAVHLHDMRLVCGRDAGYVLSQRSTITTHIKTAIHDGWIGFRTSDEDRHLLRVRTYQVEGFC